MTLESRVGQGSSFTVRIPLQLPGNRKFDVNLTDERIDLSKARRIEPRVPPAHAAGAPVAEVGAFRRGLAEPAAGG